MQLIEPEQYGARFSRALSLFANGEFGQAISAMDALIEEDTYLAQAYWIRALCYDCLSEKPEDYARAIDDYTKSIIYAENPTALSFGRRGILYFKSGQFELALADLNRALDIDLLWVEAQYYRGRTFLALSGDTADLINAEDDFTDVLRGVDKPFGLAHFFRGQTRRRLGMNEGAFQDYTAAIAIDPDDMLSINALGYCHEKGIGTVADMQKAQTLYLQAAQKGLISAQKNLARTYGTRTAEAAAKRAYWLRQAAKAGDPEAQNIYGLMHLDGIGIPCNPHRAVYYFNLAAEQHYTPAICNLAECYEFGEGVPQDERRAFELCELAASLGSQEGIYKLAKCHYLGSGTAEDNAKAFAIAKPVADNGYAPAQDFIGTLYDVGKDGVTQDYKLALKYYRAAYRQGHLSSGISIATLYRDGHGVKKNMAEVIRLLTEMADKGMVSSRIQLGKTYFEDKHDYENAAKALGQAFDEGETRVAVMYARALLLKAEPEPELAYKVLLEAGTTGRERLFAAVCLCEFELYGAYHFPPNPQKALKRLEKLLPATKSELYTLAGISCAYVTLAHAHELGIGTARDEAKAAELYALAEKHGRNTLPFVKLCRCYTAAAAHKLYSGVGQSATAEDGDIIVNQEVQTSKPADGAVLLYIWSQLRHGTPEDPAALAKLAEATAKAEPRDPAAAYTLYYLKRGPKNKAKLEEALRTASPYMRHKIERHMFERPNEPMYPILTAEDVDSYRQSQACVMA